jgi:hypothetical protein
MSKNQICKSNQIKSWFHWRIPIVLSLLLEWCDATKKATMKTTKFARSNQTYNAIVVYGHTDIRKSFSVIQFGGDLHYLCGSTRVKELQCQLYHHTSLSPILKWTLLKHVFGFTNCNLDTQNPLTKGAPRVVLFHMRHNSSATCWSQLLMSFSITIIIQAKTSLGFSPINPRARLSSI